MMLPIAQHRALGFRSHAPGFRSVSMRSEPSFDLDPFLNVDFFVMSEPTFPPHPHAGFSAVTYLLPESRGSFRNRDSLGDTSTIGPGAIHWTQAGAGMMHEEIPSTPGVEGTGFQIFVNLPAAQKGIAPRAFHADATHVPVVSLDGSLVRVLAGAFGGTEGALGPGLALVPDLLDLTIDAGKTLEVPIVRDRRAWMFVISGEAKVGPRTLAANEAVLFADGPGVVRIEAQSRTRAMLFAGDPLRQPVVWHGPFSMTDEREAREAVERYRGGEMGQLAPSF